LISIYESRMFMNDTCLDETLMCMDDYYVYG
jgi:hypothetical protein